MAWPPPVLSINRTNADPQQDQHPADHNALALASNDTVAMLKTRLADYGQQIASAPTIAVQSAGWVPVASGGGIVHGCTGTHIYQDPNSLLCRGPGFYIITGYVAWSTGSGTGRRIIGITSTINAATPPSEHQSADTGMASSHGQSFACGINVTNPTGQRFMLTAYQDSGAGMTIVARAITAVRVS